MPNPPPTPQQALAGPDPAGGSLREYFASLRSYPRGAWMAICAGIIAMILGPSVVNNLTTYMLAPVSEDFGWSQSQTVLLMSSLPLFSSPFVLTFGGYLVDKVSMRTVAVWSSLIYGVAFCLMVVVSASALFGVLAIVALAGSQVCAQVVGFKTVSIWFPRHRGVGFSLISAVASLSSAVYSPLFEWSTSSFSWRYTYLVLGLCVLVLCVPAQIVLLSQPDATPPAPGARPVPDSGPVIEASAPAGPQEHRNAPGVPLAAALRSRAWLLLMLIILVPTGVTMSVRTLGVDLFGERGYGSGTVSLALSVFWLASFAGQSVAGPVMDRSKSARAAFPFFASVLLGMLIVTTTHGTTWLLFVALALLGGFQGAEYTIAPYLLGRYFGDRSFAPLLGLTLGITGVVAFGTIPFLVQVAVEQAGTYDGVLLVMLVAIVIATAVAFFMPRYPEPETEAAKELTADRDVPAPAPGRDAHP